MQKSSTSIEDGENDEEEEEVTGTTGHTSDTIRKENTEFQYVHCQCRFTHVLRHGKHGAYQFLDGQSELEASVVRTE